MEPISEPWSFHVGVVYENICSMKDTPSQEPRDEALRAALHDAGLLAGLVQGVFHASYSGSRRDVYLAALGPYLADLGGSLERKAGGKLARLEEPRPGNPLESRPRGQDPNSACPRGGRWSTRSRYL